MSTTSSSKTISILYIDDYELDRELVKDVLEHEHGGFRVYEASNKIEFEKLLKSQKFDVVLSDFNIAGYEGLQVLEMVRTVAPHVPVIIVTGTGSEEIAVTALKQGASDYVIKRPRHIKRLPQTILAVLDKKSLRNQQQQAEQSLRESEEKFRALAENSLVGIYIIREGSFDYVNPQFAEMFGYTQAECLEGITLDQLVFPDDLEMVKSRIRLRQQKESTIDEYETRGVRRDGTVIHISVFGSSIVLNDRLVAMGMLLDISRRRRVEESLQSSQQKYQSIVENIGLGVMLISSQMEVLELNRQMRKWFPDVDLGDKPICFEAFNDPPSETYCSNCPTIKTLKDGRVHETTKSMTTETSIRNLRIVSSPIHDEAGKVEAAIGMVEDITERRKLESQLQQSQKLESIGNLAGGIAHDFNNVLASIIGYTELALDDVDKGSVVESHLREVYSAGKRARDLVRRILTFARQSEEETKPLQVKPILMEVLQFMRSSIPSTIKIEAQLESDSFIMGNATQVHQVIMNLCTNAADAMEENGGILEVKLRNVTVGQGADQESAKLDYGAYVEMVISDSGMGIGPDVIDLVFEPYFTTKGPGQGTGMGLAVVHGIVESYGGEITARNRQGKGAEFVVYFPITEKRTTKAKFSLEDVPMGNERILLVDDEVSIAQLSHQSLSRLGYSVTIRTSSVEALELFRARPRDFDLVITDLTMPNMTGDQLAVAMMKIRPDIPTVLCTGYNRKMSEERALDLGIRAFIYKPVVIADLAKTIRKALGDGEG